MKTTNCLVALVLALFMGVQAFAQEKRMGQATFIYPLGTAGTESPNYSNQLSFNVLAGINGGVKGFELGSLVNINKGDVEGVQIAGISNLTSESNSGAIISGVANLTQNSTEGNQIAGVCNFNKGNTNGVSVAGVVNYTQDESKGAMVSGVVNFANSYKGLQLSTVNIASGKLDGAQIGVVNIARKAKGLQLGVVNLCDSSDNVIPIGLISIVKNGYYALELTTNELLLTNLSFKMGTEKFHSIFKVGLGSYKSESLFSYAAGFGTMHSLGGRHALDAELVCENLVYDGNWNDNLNLLNYLSLNYRYNITDFLAIKAGPSIRTYVTNQKVNGKYNTIDIPYTLYDHTSSKNKTSVWIGFNAGVSIKL